MKLLKKTSALLLALLAVLTCSVFSVNAEERIEHKNYINGFSDGLFHPNDTLSRAETAQMFANLNPDIRGGSASFTDVKNDAWYYDAVTALSSAGIMSGYADGSFKPAKAVTRAEFVTIMYLLSGKKGKNGDGGTSFSDVPQTHRAYPAICAAEANGWVKGSDGLFRPDDTITRAEAVTAINRYLGRLPDKTAIDLDPTARYFPDVTQAKWFYYDVMEAAVSHTVVYTTSGELWMGITRYPTVLPDGFAVIGDTLRLIKGGWFVSTEGDGTFGGIKYTSDEHGAVSVPDGLIPLSGGDCVIVQNGSFATEDGLYFMPAGLYCISGGLVLRDGKYGSLSFGSDGRYTSGNKTIDDYIDTIVSSVTTDGMSATERLLACYGYVYHNVSYRANNNHVPRGAEADEWTEEYALRLIDTGKGNCYCYAAEMYYLARRVGFDSAKAVSGGVTADNLDHGWMTVTVDGEELLLDPELDVSSGPYEGSAFMVSYRNAPFRYLPPNND